MKGCNNIKELIDGADRPDLLSFEVNQHIRGCRDCEHFADQRAGLRKLLASSPRVTAPVSFDAMLNARLAEVRNRGSVSWLGWPGYLRLGAATAGLVLMVLAAQYGGLFSDRSQRAAAPGETMTAKRGPDQPGAGPAAPSAGDAVDPRASYRETAPGTIVLEAPPTPRARRGGIPISGRVEPRDSFVAEDGGVVLVRGQSGGVDLPMPTVSLGAQPLLYVSAGKRPASNAGASF